MVLVDDGWKNILQMDAALGARGVRFHGVLYTGVKRDPSAGSLTLGGNERFQVEEDVADSATKAWGNWLAAMRQAYPERAKRLEDGDCQ